MSFEDAFIGLALEGDFLKSRILSPPAQNDGAAAEILGCYCFIIFVTGGGGVKDKIIIPAGLV